MWRETSERKWCTWTIVVSEMERQTRYARAYLQKRSLSFLCRRDWLLTYQNHIMTTLPSPPFWNHTKHWYPMYDSSSLSSTKSLDKTNTPFSVSSISIPAIISSSSSSAPHSLPKSLSYFTSRSLSTNYPFRRGEHVRKKQPFVKTVKEEDCEEGVNTVESTKSTSVSLFSQIKTKRPTVFADRGYSRCYNDRDDDDASFHSSRTSDKTNTDNNHFWYNN